MCLRHALLVIVVQQCRHRNELSSTRVPSVTANPTNWAAHAWRYGCTDQPTAVGNDRYVQVTTGFDWAALAARSPISQYPEEKELIILIVRLL